MAARGGPDWEGFRAERDGYLADEAAAAYSDDLRFYTDPDWPYPGGGVGAGAA